MEYTNKYLVENPVDNLTRDEFLVYFKTNLPGLLIEPEGTEKELYLITLKDNPNFLEEIETKKFVSVLTSENKKLLLNVNRINSISEVFVFIMRYKTFFVHRKPESIKGVYGEIYNVKASYKENLKVFYSFYKAEFVRKVSVPYVSTAPNCSEFNNTLKNKDFKDIKDLAFASIKSCAYNNIILYSTEILNSTDKQDKVEDVAIIMEKMKENL